MNEHRRRSIGVAAGFLVGTAILLALTKPVAYFGPPLDTVFVPAAGVALVLALGAIAAVLAVLAVLTRRTPLLVRSIGTGAALVVLATVVVVVGFTVAGATGDIATAIALSLAIAALLMALMAIIGGSLATLVGGRAPPRRRARAAATLAAAAAVVFALVVFLRAPGDATLFAEAVRTPTPTAIALDDPTEAGPYEVATLTYGSGLDRHRSVYGPTGPIMSTSSVDASHLWSGWPRARTAYWGFDTTALPRNARVWYPVGDGPFPLVLIAHGNHPLSMWQSAEEGYAYLAEGLASRGYVVAAVDQNFLNMAPERYRAPAGETLVRGWLLLEHLRLWRTWQALGTTPLGTSIDMSRIALIGHSRGGEAVAVAAALNAFERLPDDARVPLAYGFDIRAVAAIAPTDTYDDAGGRRLPLEGVNYLVLHGANDNDVQGFQGSRTFARADVSGEGLFKAAVYVDRANHGQFNAAWGPVDRTGAAGWFLDVAALMDAEAQRRVATVFVTSFLAATLGGDDGYREVLRDHRHAWPWLPEVTFHTQYQDSTFLGVATYDDGVDPGRTSVAGGRIEGDGFVSWVEDDVELRSPRFFGTRESRAVHLAWREGGAHYTLLLPDDLTLPEHAAWTFAFAYGPSGAATAQSSARGEPSTGAAGGADAQDGADAPSPGLEPTSVSFDVTLELVWSDGASAALPLSEAFAVQPPIASRLTRFALVESPSAPPTFQSVTIPLTSFPEVAGPGATIAALRFRFDRQPAGAVLLDDIGFVGLPAATSAP